jgi:two-component system, chemotaxis family, chemotaxis protein CheY
MKILIVDDSKAMRMIVRRHVEQARLPELEVLEAANGLEALEIIRADEPDLVFSDWNMPEMSGMELLNALRAEGSSVRFGFVTSESQPHMKDQALDAGALFLIVKPFTADDFQSVIARVL